MKQASGPFRNLLPVFLIVLPCFIHFHALTAEEVPSPEKQQAALYQMGFLALQSGEYDKSRMIALKLRDMDPRDELGYRLSVMSDFMRKDFMSVIAAVQIAKAFGVESVFLYKYQTQALFFVGDFSASMQGFRRIENFMEREMQAAAKK